MWQVDNRTPHAADATFARDMTGAEVWIVAVRGAFDIKPDGTLAVARVPSAVVRSAIHFDRRAGADTSAPAHRSSLRYESDLVLAKPGTDLLVHGTAHAPKGKPAPRVEVGLRCGPISKRLLISGNRVYRRGLFDVVPSDPEPFVTMPIRYERAFGGAVFEADPRHRPAPRNPIGVGLAERAEDLVGTPAPNVEDPEDLITGARSRPAPAGLGPIPRDWSPRAALAGTFDARWEEDRAPLWPEDFDLRFFHAAPADQQAPGFLREGALVELLHLTPEGLLSFHLPRRRPVFQTFFDREVVRHRARLHTVVVEPDDRRLIVVWHTAVRCQGKEHKLSYTLIEEKAYV